MEIDLTDEDIEIVEERLRINTHASPVRSRNVRSRWNRLERLFLGLPNRNTNPQRHGVSTQTFNQQTLDDFIQVGLEQIFIPPTLDFDVVGFDMGLDRGETASPAYQAPAPAPEGFTRSPKEEDVLVCPNCGDELCTGKGDLKQQVWIVKGCGHVYCGECTANRSKSSRKKANGKEPIRANAFKACVVDGCGKKTSAKNSMIQLFL